MRLLGSTSTIVMTVVCVAMGAEGDDSCLPRSSGQAGSEIPWPGGVAAGFASIQRGELDQVSNDLVSQIMSATGQHGFTHFLLGRLIPD